jgi:peptide/nickel transport system substrate-binding protein
MFDFSWLESHLTVRSRLVLQVLRLVALALGTFALAASGNQTAHLSQLRVAFDARPRTVDPRFVSTDANSQYLEPLLFLPLFGFSETGVPLGVLAEKHQFTDPKTLIIKMRDGIRFASGRDVNADDVVETYRFILGQNSGQLPASPRRGVFERVASVAKTPSGDVQFTLTEPDVSLVSNLVVGILPREAVGLPPDTLFPNKGFESGPFVMESFNDSEWIISRNDKYSGAPFGGSLPALQRVVFKIFPDNNTRYAALLKGDIDLVQNGLDTDKVVEFSQKRGSTHNVQFNVADSTTFLGFNLKNKFLSDVRVRRAIGHVIQREEILKFTLQGMGRLADSMFPPSHVFHYKNEKPLNYDLREAQLLLSAAGYPDPDGTSGPRERASFTIKVPLNRERIAVAKAIAGQLKKVGLKVKVEVLEFNTFMKHLNDGNVQAWISPWTGYKDGDHLHFVFHSQRTPPKGANRGSYANSELDKLLDQAKSESNTVARIGLYRKAQAIIAEDNPYIFLWHRTGNAVTGKGVSGFKTFPDGRYSSLTNVIKR